MSLELTAQQREQLGRAALDWALKYFEEQSRLPIYPSTNPTDLTRCSRRRCRSSRKTRRAVMADFEHIAANGRHNGHPRMFGYVQSAGSFAGVVGDLLASALNQNVTSWRSAPAATTIEHQVIDWLKTMVGFDPGGAGILLSGGSFANFAGLAAALRASTDVDVQSAGRGGTAGQAAHLCVGDDAHVDCERRVVARHRQGRGRRGAGRRRASDGSGVRSARQIASDRANGYHAICAVATAGDVNTGAIDPLDAIADVCAANKLWLHVDGSLRRAGGAVAARRGRDGGAWPAPIRCRSIRTSGSTRRSTPAACWSAIARALRHAFSEGADYIDVVADRDMSDYAYWDHSPELSRRFRALKIWFVLKIHGARAIQQAIDDNIAAAAAPGPRRSSRAATSSCWRRRR